ncbi:MAG: hypothetical protein AABX31_04975 [Nanoarchaeota archaeon]
MPTKFLLNLGVLDDRFADSSFYIGIEAEGAGCVDSDLPKYYFFQENKSLPKILQPEGVLDLSPKLEDACGYPKLVYAKASLFFLPVNDGFAAMPLAKQAGLRDRLLNYEVFYSYGEFLKGDAEKFREYGILIK